MTENLAFRNLKYKQVNGKKGRTIVYEDKLKMAEYLWPNNILNLEEQRLIFQIRSEINPIPANLGNPGQCPTNCGELFENPHILVCKNINESPTETYEMLINGNLNEKKKAVTAWMKNMKIFEEKSALDSIF